MSEISSKGHHQIGLVSAVALCVGTMVGGGVFAVSGIVINKAGPSAIVSYLLAAVAVLLSALCFAAVASRAKEGSTGYEPIATVLGPMWRFLTMWAFYVSAIAGGAFMLVAFGSYLRYFFEGSNALVFELVAAVALIILNLGPADLVGRAETVMVAFKIGVLVLLIGFGLAAFNAHDLTPFAPRGLGPTISSAGLLFSVYLGFSVVTNVAGVVKNSKRNVPLAILLSLVIVTIVYVGITLAMVMSGRKVFGIAGAAQAARILIGPWGGALIAVAACVSTLSGSNAVILGCSELLIRMAGNGDIPSVLGRVSRSGHAYASVLLSGGLAIVLMVTGGIQTIVTYCSVAGIVGLVLMDVTAFQMARKHWSTPGLRLPFGVFIPSVAAILALAQFPSLGALNVSIGLVLVAAGLVIYALRHHSHRQDHETLARHIQTMETPLSKAFRRPAAARELG